MSLTEPLSDDPEIQALIKASSSEEQEDLTSAVKVIQNLKAKSKLTKSEEEKLERLTQEVVWFYREVKQRIETLRPFNGLVGTATGMIRGHIARSTVRHHVASGQVRDHKASGEDR